jgi:hypothetical protein
MRILTLISSAAICLLAAAAMAQCPYTDAAANAGG